MKELKPKKHLRLLYSAGKSKTHLRLPYSAGKSKTHQRPPYGAGKSKTHLRLLYGPGKFKTHIWPFYGVRKIKTHLQLPYMWGIQTNMQPPYGSVTPDYDLSLAWTTEKPAAPMCHGFSPLPFLPKEPFTFSPALCKDPVQAFSFI
uniref:Uncharacterized protein n=1 Tax=Oryzias melastigma TaxID=30732 RepID=A0A3B3CLI8_ORYME